MVTPLALVPVVVESLRFPTTPRRLGSLGIIALLVAAVGVPWLELVAYTAVFVDPISD